MTELQSNSNSCRHSKEKLQIYPPAQPLQLVAVTNRRLCRGDFLQQIEKLRDSGITAILLREKDLSTEAYLALARDCQQLLAGSGVSLVINSQVEVARQLGLPAVQVGFPFLAQHHQSLRDFQQLWVSVHSMEEAVQAQAWCAHRIIAGHIFATDCKPGLAPRGTGFLQQVCQAVTVPVYAIGGINQTTIGQLEGTGAAGCCIMSQSMAETLFWCQRAQTK